MLEKIKLYLDQLNERERRAVIAAAVALALYLPYQIIWSPFMHSLNELESRVDQQQKDLTWMQDRVAEAKELARATGGHTGGAQPVYGVIESTARERFGGDIRVQQEGKVSLIIVQPDGKSKRYKVTGDKLTDNQIVP